MKVYNFETYAKVSTVSPGTGSEMGGSTITIGGEWFDSTTQNAVVNVGGEECNRPGDITDEEIVCLTPAKPANDRGIYPGNRGVNKDYWTYADAAAMPALTNLPTGDPAESEWGDSMSWGAREGSFISRSKFFFNPPNDNTYQFVLFDCSKPADDFLLRFEDESGEVSEWTCPGEGRGYSPRIPLVAEHSYYMEAWYRRDASAGGDSESDKRVAFKMFDTDYVGGQNIHARNERQKIKIASTVFRETQVVSSSGSGFTITHGGVTTESISAGASASDVQATLQAIYQNQCPEEVANPIGAITKFATDYEGRGAPSWFTGTVVKADETAPFCGGKSLMNPTTVYNTDPENDYYPIKISIEKTVCFAYKGSLASRVFLRYGSEGEEGENSEWFGPNDYDGLDFSANEEWQYTCLDLQDMFATARPDATNVIVKELRFDSTSADSDFFIDNLFIGKAEPMAPGDVADGIRQAAMPNDVVIDEVQVETVAGGYSVSFVPFNCGYNLPLMESQGGVTRQQAGSPPVQGTFDISFDGQTSSVKAEATEEEMANKLKLDLGIEAKVTLGGDCSGQIWEVEWNRAGGNQPQMELDGGSLTGDEVEIEVKTVDDGGLFFYEIPGSMTRTAHDTPQVEVLINGIPSRCDGSGCGFSWAADRTPTVTSISPDQGTGGTEVTITGTGFSTNCDDNRVRIGRSEDTEEGVMCTPTTCTETSITCTTGSAGQGSQRVKVKVLPHGDDPDANPNGKASGDVSFTYLGGITSISPTTCGLGGGVELTITGNGFADDDIPKVGENNCPVVSRSDTEIKCTVPSASTAGSVDVTVSGPNDAVLTSSDQFSYDEARTPIITSYTPEEITVAGGETLTLEGGDFGDSPTLTLDCDSETVAVDASVTESGSVTATLPSLSPGECDILLFVADNGYAMVRDNTRKRSANRFTLPGINVNLKVTGMDVSQGSLLGGTEVTFSGKGFGDDVANIEVKFGDVDCEVLSSSGDEMTVRTGSTAASHTVTNDGAHPEHGTGYAWDPADVTVAVGDRVVWSWSSSGSDTNYGVHQTTDSTGEVLSGFSSGGQTSSGTFSYTFTSEGSYYYTSGSVDPMGEIKMLGKVTVVAAADSTEALSVKVSGKEAKQNPSGSRGRRSSGSCPGGIDSLLSCSGDPPEAPEGAVYSFSFRNCMTAVVNNVSPTQGIAGTVLTIPGQGFSTEACENVVMTGEHQCEILTASEDTLTCRVTPGDSMPVGMHLGISVNVKNRGNALMDNTFVLLPSVTSVSPAQGSTEGGTTIVISGSGFTDGTTVMIGSSGCDAQSVSYNEIFCTTQAASALTRDVVVTTSSGRVGCDGECQYSHRDSATPRVVSVDPSTAFGASTDFTISGVLFGTDADAVTVEIGGTPCQVTAVTDGSISCTAGALLAGSNPVTVVNTLGKAASSASVDSPAQIDSISPSSGSMAGGTVVTFSGNGFGEDTTVTMGDGRECTIDGEITSTGFSCITPAATEEGDHTVQMSVQSNGETYPSQSFNYAAASTPVVSGITPSTGKGGDTVTIIGSLFDGPSSSRRRRSSGNVAVSVGSAPCPVTALGGGQLQCTLGNSVAGSGYAVSVTVAGMGLATSSVTFSYALSLDSVSPTTGGSAQLDCDVEVEDNGVTATLSDGFTYDSSMTPVIDSVSPSLGGTAGGTTITIAGSNLGGIDSVAIDGSTCDIEAGATDTQLTCVTGAHQGSVEAKVTASGTNGIATQDNADFYYVDRWSSVYTWGGEQAGLPEAGDFIIVGEGQTLLLDTDTPVLKMVLIDGKHVAHTWTLLAQTAEAGSDTLVLEQAVSWEAGDRVVIATTGHRHSQGETEEREILSVSNDGRTIMLTESLEFEHLGEKVTVGDDGLELSFQAEVGLLSRTVLVQGSSTASGWDETIEACPEGFDTGKTIASL
ncbi:fibrocystin-L-like [Branchiostoma floridae]|uniref:Fibrocystin-L-like n=1 Tax=Branchiostoma floridae TaxID=7739 RepID=A0A9J7HWT5_BRAFL|nr:fibrocystin-L-like [Branchiostoma floridae]